MIFQVSSIKSPNRAWCSSNQIF